MHLLLKNFFLASYFSNCLHRLLKNTSLFLCHLFLVLLPLPSLLHSLAVIWRTLSFRNRVDFPRTVKSGMYFLQTKAFILLSVTLPFINKSIKSYYFLYFFSIYFIYGTNTVYCRKFGKYRERNAATYKVNLKSHLVTSGCLFPVSFLYMQCTKNKEYSSVWVVVLAFSSLLLVQTKESGLLVTSESPTSLGTTFVCCFRLHFCFAWDEYCHLYACGVTTSHTLYWPTNYSYFCLPLRLNIPVPH